MSSHAPTIEITPQEKAEIVTQMCTIARGSPTDIYSREGASMLADVCRRAALAKADNAETSQRVATGRKDHLFDLQIVREYRDANPHHAACIEAKIAASVGLGMREEDVEDTLDPLCSPNSWHDLLNDVAEDYWETGNGYIEVVRGDVADPSVVTGLHHIPAAHVYVVIEGNDPGTYHYEVRGEILAGHEQRFARFGDLEDFTRRAGGLDQRLFTGGTAIGQSEVIHWRRATTRSRYYGYPDYFSAVPNIELVQCMTQHQFDFYFNRGVPEFLLLFLGKMIQSADWLAMKQMVMSHQGLGNSRKSAMLNIPDPDITVEMIKMGMEEAAEETFAKHSEVTARNIVTAHGVPPLLAGVLLPGKMGAANETPQALALFQALKIGRSQRQLSALLATTLGSDGQKMRTPNDSGTKSVSAEQFRPKTKAKDDFEQEIGASRRNGFLTILEEINVGEMDTISRMRTPAGQDGRDPAEGLRQNGRDAERTGGGRDPRAG